MERGNAGKALCLVRARGKGLGKGRWGGEPPPLFRHSCRAGSSPGRVSGIICTADAKRRDTQRRTHTGESRGQGVRGAARRGAAGALPGALCSLWRAVSPRAGAAAARRRRPGASPAAPGHPGTATQRRPTARSAPYPRGRAAPSGPADRTPPLPIPPASSPRGAAQQKAGAEVSGEGLEPAARRAGGAGEGRGYANEAAEPHGERTGCGAHSEPGRRRSPRPAPPRVRAPPAPPRPAPHRRSMGRGRGGSCGRDMAGGRGCPARR